MKLPGSQPRRALVALALYVATAGLGLLAAVATSGRSLGGLLGLMGAALLAVPFLVLGQGRRAEGPPLQAPVLGVREVDRGPLAVKATARVPEPRPSSGGGTLSIATLQVGARGWVLLVPAAYLVFWGLDAVIEPSRYDDQVRDIQVAVLDVTLVLLGAFVVRGRSSFRGIALAGVLLMLLGVYWRLAFWHFAAAFIHMVGLVTLLAAMCLGAPRLRDGGQDVPDGSSQGRPPVDLVRGTGV